MKPQHLPELSWPLLAEGSTWNEQQGRIYLQIENPRPVSKLIQLIIYAPSLMPVKDSKVDFVLKKLVVVLLCNVFVFPPLTLVKDSMAFLYCLCLARASPSAKKMEKVPSGSSPYSDIFFQGSLMHSCPGC